MTLRYDQHWLVRRPIYGFIASLSNTSMLWLNYPSRIFQLEEKATLPVKETLLKDLPGLQIP